MDSVRFGRVLGIGTRLAAKTLVQAVDAATAPNPSATPGSGRAPEAGASAKAGETLGQQAVRTTAQVLETGQGLARGGKIFRETVWGRVSKLSGVLWLELTGVFFGLFAFFAVGGAWRLRGEWRETGLNHDGHVHFLWAVAMAVVFGYFCVSSFVRANRRERGRERR